MIHKIEKLTDRSKVFITPLDFVEVLYSDLTGANTTEKAADLKTKLQTKLDKVEPKTDYPTDDPVYENWGDRNLMGLLDNQFVSGDDLITRYAKVESVVYNDPVYTVGLKEYRV